MDSVVSLHVDDLELFSQSIVPPWASRAVSKSRSKELKELFNHGLGIHNAGLLRCDRSLTEKLFSAGLIRVLVTTSTLAWGVNLPAHTVVIKGTQLYDANRGGFVDLSMLDVMQIFGFVPPFSPVYRFLRVKIFAYLVSTIFTFLFFVHRTVATLSLSLSLSLPELIPHL